jgi:hypothetical protein
MLILKYHIHLCNSYIKVYMMTSSVFYIEPSHVHLTSSSSKGFVDHYRFMGQVKVKGKVHPEVKHRYSSTLSFNFSTIRRWVVNAMPWSLYPWDRPGTHCIGGLVGPRAGLDGCGKSRPHRNSIPGPSSQ